MVQILFKPGTVKLAEIAGDLIIGHQMRKLKQGAAAPDRFLTDDGGRDALQTEQARAYKVQETFSTSFLEELERLQPSSLLEHAADEPVVCRPIARQILVCPIPG